MPYLKILALGWDLLAATPDVVLANAEKFDASGVDGVFVEVRFSQGKERFSTQTIANDALWPRKELERQVLPSLREFPKHGGLKESLVGAWFMPQSRLDWNDDAAWARFAANVGELAWLANASGLKGVWFDTEDYAHQRQYVYHASDAPTFEDAERIARRRGEEMSKALFAGHPDAVVMATWFLSVRAGYAFADNPCAAVRSAGDLWPAFLNGMLSAAPASAKFVDGCETGYTLDSHKGEFRAYDELIRRNAAMLVDAANMRKFRTLFATGFGLYLDMYMNKPGGEYYFGPAADGSRLTRFKENFDQAAECASSGYVWVYGEKRSWVDWSGVPPQLGEFQRRWGDMLRESPGTWERQLPGLAMAMRERRRQWASRPLGGLWSWTAPGGHAVEFHRKGGGAVSVPGPARGCVGADVQVGRGERIRASFRAKGVGAYGAVAFKKGAELVDKWPRIPLVYGNSDVDGWRSGEACMDVPDGATSASLIVSVNIENGREILLDDFSAAVLPRQTVQKPEEPKISVFASFIRRIAKERGVSKSAAADLLYDAGVRGYDCGPDEGDLDELAATKLRPINFYYFPDWFNRKSQDWNTYYADKATPEECIALAKKYGIPRIMVVPPSFTDGKENEAEFGVIIRKMAEFVARVRKDGIAVTVEDFGGTANCCSYAKYLKRLLNEIPDLRFALDSGNLYYAGRGEDILEMMEFAKGRIGHVHLKDQSATNNREYVTLGLGAVSNEKIVKAVAATDYNGWYTLENPVGDTYNDTVRQVALVKAWLSAAKRGKLAE